MGIDRRSFIKFAAGAGLGVTASPLPWKMIDDVAIWTQNWPWIPSNPKGESVWAATTSKYCPSACGLKVRMVGGQAVRGIGDADHPLGGGLSPLAAAEIQMLNSPSRVKRPLRRTTDGRLDPISWEEAEKILLDKLGAAGPQVACVSGDETGSSLGALSALLAGRGSNQLYVMPSEAQAAGRAWRLMGGKGQVGYDLEGSDFVLAVGANVLESWGTFIRNRRVFASSRGETPGASFVYAGPVQNQSAAVADQWIPLRPGSELVFLLGLCALLAQQGRSVEAADFLGFRDMLAGYDPQQVNALTEVSVQVLQSAAAALIRAERPLILAGSECGYGGGAATVMAGLALNLLLGGKGLRDIPLSGPVLPGEKSRPDIQAGDLAAYMGKGAPPQALLFYSANPAYALPGPKTAREFIQATPFKAAFTSFLDETASLCDLVLPVTFSMEGLDDLESPYGCAKPFYAVCRKLVDGPAEARPGLELILDLSAKLGKKLASSAQDVIKARAKALSADANALNQGKVFEGSAASLPGRFALLPEIMRKAAESVKNAAPTLLAPLSRTALGTAQSGIPPFNAKLIRAGELEGNGMQALLNRTTAYSRGLQDGDLVRISAGQGEIVARVRIFEGIVPDALALTMGLGHTALDVFSLGKGANVADLFEPAPEEGSGLTVWNRVGLTVVKV
ncbi:MAG: molybdopterin-dependent oxidoreductase [Desulfovibrionaceae bacterium]|nr:molybdopterin-dependent oxidoreductase [Desulfovibrionaceae bacterium]